MAEFVRFTLDDGSEVLFESAESDLVALHGGPPDLREGGRLAERLAPDEVSLEFGLNVSDEVNWWFFAKAQDEGTIKVTLKWAGNAAATAPTAAHGAGSAPGEG